MQTNQSGADVLQYILSDHLGSTSTIVDASGDYVSRTGYMSWGDERFSTADIPTDYRYTGQRLEDDLGIYYYNARWYDPSIGRFLQADTIVPDPGNPLAYDRYAYSLNNPLLYIDPSGHSPLLVIGLGLMLIGVATGLATYNTGSDYEATASSQPATIAQEQAAAQQWQDNCIGQCHYAHAVDPTPGAVVSGPRPDTPVSDMLGLGQLYQIQGVIGIIGSVATFGSVAISEFGTTPTQSFGNSTGSTTNYLPETKSPNPVRPQNVTDQWDEFLGEGSYTDIGPNNIQYRDRIFSADRTRSIRYGNHEMTVRIHHFHAETWTFNQGTGVFDVTNLRYTIQPR